MDGSTCEQNCEKPIKHLRTIQVPYETPMRPQVEEPYIQTQFYPSNLTMLRRAELAAKRKKAGLHILQCEQKREEGLKAKQYCALAMNSVFIKEDRKLMDKEQKMHMFNFYKRRAF